VDSGRIGDAHLSRRKVALLALCKGLQWMHKLSPSKLSTVFPLNSIDRRAFR